MADAPFISGSEIVNNPGNAALGYSGGVALGALPTANNPLQGIDDTLSRVQSEDNRWNEIKYAQRQKDMDDLTKTLSGTDTSVFNVKGANGKDMSFDPLDADRQLLNQKADDLRNFVLKNPDKYQFDPNYYKQKEELDQLRNHAGKRSVFVASAMQQAAAENDPEQRVAILKNLSQEIDGHNLTDFHSPAPSRPLPTFDVNNWLSDKDLADKDNYRTLSSNIGTVKGPDGRDTQVENKQIGFDENKLDFRQGLTPGSKGYADAVNFTNRYFGSPRTMNPQAIIAQNQTIDAINKQRGWVDDQGNPINAHAIPHIADVVQGQGGQPQIKINTQDPAQVAYASMAARFGGLKQSQEVSDKGLQQDKDKAEVQKLITDNQYEGKIKAATLEKLYTETQKDKADIASTNLGTQEKAQQLEKLKQTNGKAASIVADVLNSYKGIRTSKLGWQAASDLPDYVKSQIPNPEEYEFAPLPLLKAKELTDIGGKEFKNEKGAATGYSAKPDAGYYLRSKNGDISKDIFIPLYKKENVKKDDPDKYEIGAVSVRDGINNKLQAQYNFKLGATGNSQLEVANSVYDAAIGTINPAISTSTTIPKQYPGYTFAKTIDGKNYYTDNKTGKSMVE